MTARTTSTSTSSGYSRLIRRTGNDEKNLDQQRWYHGICSREDVETLLTKQGEFLVRASENQGNVNIILSLHTGERKLHLTIAVDKEYMFYLQILGNNARRFKSVYDLISNYRRKGLKLKSSEQKASKDYLKYPVPRPKWMVKSSAISYDPKSKPLGSGHFAKVYVGTFRVRDENGKHDMMVAIKVLREKAGASDESSRQAKTDMIREGRVMSYYNNPYIVQFYGLSCDTPQQVIIVMEFCPGGSLLGHLIAEKGKIPVNERLCYCLEAAQGMRYLHSQKCVHRDLASRNCLISSRGVIKIADFGLSTADNITEQDTASVFPLRWMAPETVVKENRVFSYKSDIWSYGVFIYEVFNDGEKPWPQEDKKVIMAAIQSADMPSLPDCVPPGVKLMVDHIWTLETQLRPSFAMIVRHLRVVCTGDLSRPKAAHFTLNHRKGVRRCDPPSTAPASTAKIEDEEMDDSDSVSAGSERSDTVGSSRKRGGSKR